MTNVRNILILLFVFFSLNFISSQSILTNYNFNYKFSYFDATNDSTQKTKPKIEIENPFKGIDLDWFNQKYRLEKIFIACGIISMVIGLPMAMVGVFGYFFPQTDKSNVGDNTYFSLIGVGSGLVLTGITFTIIGVVRLNYLKSKEKLEVSFGFYNTD
ncbi:MAG: hypothetical protein A2086_01280 [Spirochaetes bacterium GWD1_27_9]|nr:MAG: hypothetical protein A2Y34_18805 [Spirochaetes bacterium GWC1_27_15]OHD44351.1 MAG: hypothetical protein A2086_01280 [Spirochaetes bacterium GWD1_27_9]